MTYAAPSSVLPDRLPPSNPLILLVQALKAAWNLSGSKNESGSKSLRFFNTNWISANRKHFSRKPSGFGEEFFIFLVLEFLQEIV